MKKTGLLTWFTYNNYGTVLQLYALNKIISGLGFKNEIINYIPKAAYKEALIVRIKKHTLFTAIQIRRKIREKIYKKHRAGTIQRDEKFDAFRAREFVFSRECGTASELFQMNGKYDGFICGSDQIWSPLCFDERYFLDFVTDARKLIAYGPSIGVKNIANGDIAGKMKTLIGRFAHLSVREESGKEIIDKLGRKDSELVLDPALLLEKQEWDTLLDKYPGSGPDGDYILCYFLGDNERHWRSVRKFAVHTGLPVKVIPVFSKDYCRPYEIMTKAGPADFLRLVKTARYICTDSFHGTIFSIIYEKQFFIFARFADHDPENQNTRIENLLRLVSMENRLVSGEKSMLTNMNEIIDFKPVKRRIAIEKEKSTEYLDNALHSVMNISPKYQIPVITNTCCGCGACAEVCAKNAIRVDLNQNGFYESRIDSGLCINCGRCGNICPFGKNSPVKITAKNPLFAAYSKDKTALDTSSSGGIAWELARYYHQKGTDVFGCIYDAKKRSAESICIEPRETEKLPLLKGSKYLQSDTRVIYNKVSHSKGGVFFGTPCQVEAARLFLEKNNTRGNFLLVDLICHGVPSGLLWQKYLTEGNIRYHYGENPDVQFRYKRYGWEEIYIYTAGNGVSRIRKSNRDLFYRFFLLGNCYANACYECKFRDSSGADIRIGDYWGSRFKGNRRGVSMVLPLTESGERTIKLLESGNAICLIETEIADYFSAQQTANLPKPVEYDRIMADLRDDKLTLAEMAKKYCRAYEVSAGLRKAVRYMVPSPAERTNPKVSI
jgi:coenzyme F420-reducing hydrogenase beta subunit